MKIMLAGRKGVSPIIAAVLLVVITIGIGATTMAFIRTLTDTNLEAARASSAKISCGSDVKLEIPVVASELKFCYYNDTGAVNVLFHNTGTINIEGFSMTVILANGSIITNDFTSAAYSINKNQYQSYNLTPSPAVTGADTSILQWRLEPKIRAGAGGKDIIVCTDSATVTDTTEIQIC